MFRPFGFLPHLRGKIKVGFLLRAKELNINRPSDTLKYFSKSGAFLNDAVKGAKMDNQPQTMNVQEQIDAYITSQPEPKQGDMRTLHRIILAVMPACKLWFLDGKSSEGRTVTNPNIGYGLQTMKHADGKNTEFYQIGLSANTTGISVYILGLKDKQYLARTYGEKLGKATVTGYCIKFKALKNINTDVLETAIRDGVAQTT